MKRNSIVTNYIYNMLYQVLVLITPIITTPYLSRILGAEGIGIFSYAQSISAYFILFGTVGSSLYGQREIAYVQNDITEKSKLFWEINILRFITSTVSIIVFYFTFGLHAENSLIYRLLIVEILASMLDITWYFQGVEDFSKVFYRNLLIKAAGIIMIFMFVKTKSDLPKYTLCYALPLLFGNLTLWPIAIKSLGKVHGLNICRNIRPLLVFFIPQIATEVYTVLDKTMIGALASNIEQVGFYSQAQKIVKMTLCIVSSLGTVMLSAMSRMFKDKDMQGLINSVLKSYRFTFFTGIPMMFGIIGVSKNFCPWFFGPGFESVAPILALLAPIIVIIGLSNVTGRQFLLPTKKQTEFTVSVVLGAVVNFCANFLLIPRYNAVGAVVGTLVAEISVTTAQFFFVKKEIHVKTLAKMSMIYFIAGVLMCISVTLIGNLLPSSIATFVIQTVVGCLVYVGILGFFKDEMLKYIFEIATKKINRKKAKL